MIEKGELINLFNIKPHKEEWKVDQKNRKIKRNSSHTCIRGWLIDSELETTSLTTVQLTVFRPVLVCLGCHINRWCKWQTFIFSEFWKMEAQEQGFRMISFWCGLFQSYELSFWCPCRPKGKTVRPLVSCFISALIPLQGSCPHDLPPCKPNFLLNTTL